MTNQGDEHQIIGSCLSRKLRKSLGHFVASRSPGYAHVAFDRLTNEMHEAICRHTQPLRCLGKRVAPSVKRLGSLGIPAKTDDDEEEDLQHAVTLTPVRRGDGSPIRRRPDP